MELEKVHIDVIRPYWRNPRNNEKAIEAVKESIKNYGYNQPIVVDAENTIIVGHTRYKALRELGYEQVEVVVKEIPEDLAKQYRIADNKSGEKAEWDEDLLLYELREIEDPKDLEAFFDDGDLDDILSDTESNNYVIDEPSREEVEQKVKATVMPSKSGDDDEDEEIDEETQKEIDAQVEREMEETRQERLQNENEQIGKMEEKEKDKFKERADKRDDDYIEIQCPHCDEKYVLSRSELIRNSKLGKTL